MKHTTAVQILAVINRDTGEILASLTVCPNYPGFNLADLKLSYPVSNLRWLSIAGISSTGEIRWYEKPYSLSSIQELFWAL